MNIYTSSVDWKYIILESITKQNMIQAKYDSESSLHTADEFNFIIHKGLRWSRFNVKKNWSEIYAEHWYEMIQKSKYI
jgi:hypothetical protein